MTNCVSKDRFGYLGTEAAALREHLDQASAAIARAALLADEWVDKAKVAGKVVDAGQESLADMVRRKPFAALGLATAAGFGLALLMRRK